MIVLSDSIDSAEFAEHTGWSVKPHGACKGEHCVPLPPESRGSDGSILVSALSERLGMPLVRDEVRGIAALGPESAVTGRMLTTAEAPDITLPTFDGGTFSLSELRGTRVLLIAWASWCGCAHDLPVWQELREKVRPLGLEIVTVAMDTAGTDAGRAFVDRAGQQHPSLIDVAHSLGQKLGIVNVPSGVWIDENGMIVRPAEPSFPGKGAVFEELRKADLEREADRTGDTLTLTREVLRSNKEGLTPEVLERLEMTRAMADAAEPELYLQMVLDWAEHGSKSEYVLSPEDVVARSAPRSVDESTAAAHFELGQHLQLVGDHAGAVEHWREAHRLQPLNWTYKRQAWRFEYGEDGDASLYEGSMEKDLREVGPANYFPKLRP